MRKILLICGVLLLILAACDEEDLEQTTNEVDQENVVNEEETPDEVEEDESEEAKEDVEEDTDSDSVTNEEQDEKDIQDIATDVIWAQMDEDYSYLKSVAGDGVTVNEENNTIDFNTDEATHTFDFLTGIEKDDLEFRFVDGEDTDRAIVGFAAIDYENEYSYVIEMIFNDVDGDWKLTGMDINK